jgi:hypothetical protein
MTTTGRPLYLLNEGPAIEVSRRAWRRYQVDQHQHCSFFWGVEQELLTFEARPRPRLLQPVTLELDVFTPLYRLLLFRWQDR